MQLYNPASVSDFNRCLSRLRRASLVQLRSWVPDGYTVVSQSAPESLISATLIPWLRRIKRRSQSAPESLISATCGVRGGYNLVDWGSQSAPESLISATCVELIEFFEGLKVSVGSGEPH